MTVKLEIDGKQLRRLTQMLQDCPGGMEKACVRAINRTLIGMRSDAVRPQTDTTGRRRRPVKAEIHRGEKFTVPRGFVWNKQVFARTSAARLPIEKQTGPAAPEMIEDLNVFDQLQERAQQRLRQRLNHESQAVLKGYGGKR